MTGLVSRAGLQKELRALVGPWSLVLVAVSIASALRPPVTPFVAGVGAIGIGAWSMGHEYAYRTLPLLLSQPLDRRSMWLSKTMVLLSLLAVLAAVTASVARHPGALALAVAAAASALSITPWLTLLSRSARGGMLFTIALMALWYIVGTWVGTGLPHMGPDPFALKVTEIGLLVMFGPVVVLGWRTFRTLDALDERLEHVTLPETGRRSQPPERGRRVKAGHRPVAALFLKELTLQLPVLGVSAVYVAAWLGGWLLRPATRESLILVSTALHGALVPLLAGSIASAEERRMGTLEAQLLQPVPALGQWLVKAGTVIGLALLLAVGVPLFLKVLDSSMLVDRELRQVAMGMGFYRLRDLPAAAVVTALLAAIGLYVSSLSRTSVHAFLASIFVAVTVAVLLNSSLGRFSLLPSMDVVPRALIRDVELWRGGWEAHARAMMSAARTLTVAFSVLTVAGGLWLLVRFGGENHRMADRRWWPVAGQAACVLVLPALAYAFVAGLALALLKW